MGECSTGRERLGEGEMRGATVLAGRLRSEATVLAGWLRSAMFTCDEQCVSDSATLLFQGRFS